MCFKRMFEISYILQSGCDMLTKTFEAQNVNRMFNGKVAHFDAGSPRCCHGSTAHEPQIFQLIHLAWLSIEGNAEIAIC